MMHNNKWLRTIAAITVALSVFAAGCSSVNENNSGAGGSEPTESASPAPTDTADAGSDASPSPSAEASPSASAEPSADAAATETPAASEEAAAEPTAKPSAKPSAQPSAKPTAKPSVKPTAKPTAKPSTKPTNKPATAAPSAKPTAKPSEKPAATPAPSADVTASDIADKILADVELPMTISVTGEQVEDMYYFNPDDYITEGVFRQAMMNVKATELVIVKLKDEKHYDAVKEGLTKRAEDIIETFSTYLPDQHEAAKNYQILRSGTYVLLSISEDQAAIKAAFEASLK